MTACVCNLCINRPASFRIRDRCRAPRYNSPPVRSYTFRVKGEELYGDARLQLQWSPHNETLEADAVAAAQ